MTPKSPPLLFIILSVLVVAVPIFASTRGTVVGGWKPIGNLNDPEVVLAAKFAVTEHNKEANLHLDFSKVVSGESQVVAGKKYRLVISAVNGGAAKTYLAVVYYRPWDKFLKLLSFDEIKG